MCEVVWRRGGKGKRKSGKAFEKKVVQNESCEARRGKMEKGREKCDGLDMHEECE